MKRTQKRYYFGAKAITCCILGISTLLAQPIQAFAQPIQAFALTQKVPQSDPSPVFFAKDDPFLFGSSTQAEVIAPVEGQALATEPSISYDGAIVVRYYDAAGGAFKLKVAANGRSGSYPFYADNSTFRIPAVYGEGEYTISILKKISGDKYQAVATVKIANGAVSAPQEPTATKSPEDTAASTSASDGKGGWTIDTSDPYLTTLTDINWSSDLTSVAKARELCASATTDKEKAKLVYTHLVNRVSYNFDLVGKLKSGYTPSMDTTYSTKTGICYDFASLYAGMMRSVGVKCKLVKGYNTMVDGYHAWNEVYYDSKWHRIDITIDCQLREYKSSYGFASPQGKVTVKTSY